MNAQYKICKKCNKPIYVYWRNGRSVRMESHTMQHVREALQIVFEGASVFMLIFAIVFLPEFKTSILLATGAFFFAVWAEIRRKRNVEG